ncbi:hypothetical protein BWD09_07020 [Neisseria dentiae]|uniref:Phage major capsid protein n=1 Tax=Neisseria dentiae TaxID=194197 RepID=A0A1X3D9E0_9NEIS|nr:phage major capsid protein [Neisseria dentiae]OSI16510.1 hypothetical protein BWD09_07020 [Neisseria dentiae]QMT44236.1 phage major capsid protein [Neisseria dentiae]STZ49909.1 Uncharacterised protein [Neisseria dentiae]STZ83155.1 Uncharacterised protein [Neisseria dentiae]
MSLTSAELARAGKAGLDHYLKNNPIDQVDMKRPLLKHLTAKKKPFVGAREHVVEQIRKGYGSAGQWFDSSDTLNYTVRDTLEQSRFPWYEFHDGMSVSESELAANGITVDDSGKSGSVTDAEKIQLTNLMAEKMEALRLGAQERFSQDLHLSGASSTKQIVGLDGLLPLDNATGTVGGLDRATFNWWRHHADATLSTSTMHDKMEIAWRQCSKRSKGGQPNVILAGGAFIDEYRKAAQQSNTIGAAVRHVTDSGKGGVDLDISASGLYFKGIPIEYCPEWDDNFGGRDSTSKDWSKRCYFLNMNHLTLRPLQGSDFVTRHPPRAASNYIHSWAVLWRGALTMNMPSAHAVLALA